MQVLRSEAGLSLIPLQPQVRKMVDLLPCPFCNGPAGEVGLEFVTCLSAEIGAEQTCPGKLIRLDVEDAARWNTRATSARIEALEKAAQAVIDRWETPAWKDAPATAVYINALRAALSTSAQKGE